MSDYLTKQARVLLSRDLATITTEDEMVLLGCGNCGADMFYGFVDEETGLVSFAVQHIRPCEGSWASVRIERRS